MRIRNRIIGIIAAALAAASLTVMAVGAVKSAGEKKIDSGLVTLGKSNILVPFYVTKGTDINMKLGARMNTFPCETTVGLTLTPEDNVESGKYYFSSHIIADAATEQAFDSQFSFALRDVYELTFLNADGTQADLEVLNVSVSKSMPYTHAFLVTDEGFEAIDAYSTGYTLCFKATNGSKIVLASNGEIVPIPSPVPSPIPHDDPTYPEHSLTEPDIAPPAEKSEPDDIEDISTNDGEISDLSELSSEDDEVSEVSEPSKEDDEVSDMSEPSAASDVSDKNDGTVSDEPVFGDDASLPDPRTSTDTSAQNSRIPVKPDNAGQGVTTGDTGASASALAVIGLAALGTALAAVKMKKEEQ